MAENYYSLSQITEHLQKLIAKTYTREYWIKAEIAKLNYYPKSGHCYPDLVEKNKDGVKAQIRSIIWNSTYTRIQAALKNATGSELTDGMEILFKARIDYSPVHGLAFHITDIDPNYSLGKMAAEKLKSVRLLKEKGTFFKNKSLPFPLLPKRIAVISVSTSKGYHDFMNIIHSNSRGYHFFTMLFPAILQGDVAVDSIIQQMERIKRVAHHFDLVAIIRGGGGDVGLSCYNNYELAKTVATFPLPVISGIGHSTNETVVEMVSHRNTITPTDLAYMLQQQFDNLAVQLNESQRIIVESTRKNLNEKSNSISSLGNRLRLQQRSLFKNNMLLLNNLEYSLRKYATDFIPKKNNKLVDIAIKIGYLKRSRIGEARENLIHHSEKLSNRIKQRVRIEDTHLTHLSEKLTILDPVNVLKKGFSITRINGAAIKGTQELKIGSLIETEFSNGETISKINKIK